MYPEPQNRLGEIFIVPSGAMLKITTSRCIIRPSLFQEKNISASKNDLVLVLSDFKFRKHFERKDLCIFIGEIRGTIDKFILFSDEFEMITDVHLENEIKGIST